MVRTGSVRCFITRGSKLGASIHEQHTLLCTEATTCPSAAACFQIQTVCNQYHHYHWRRIIRPAWQESLNCQLRSGGSKRPSTVSVFGGSLSQPLGDSSLPLGFSKQFIQSVQSIPTPVVISIQLLHSTPHVHFLFGGLMQRNHF